MNTCQRQVPRWKNDVTGALIAVFVFLRPVPLPAQGDPIDVQVVDRIARLQVDSGFSGDILIALGDSVIWHHAYGMPRTAPGTGRAFWIASITKSFTAAAILKLCDQRRLFLHDSIGALFPEAPADKRGITVRQLLTHTAGFATTYTGGGITSRRAAVAAIFGQPLAGAPGAGYHYEDDSYELLAAIVEMVSGDSWEAYVQRELVRPAGLTQTGFWCRHQPAVPRPVPSASGETSWCGASDVGTSRDDWGHRGANGMSSTARDLLRWSRALADPQALGFRGNVEIGSPQVWVRREGAFDISSGFGSRVYVTGGRVTEVWLSGSGDDGHTAVVRALASGITVIVLSNAGTHGGTTWSSLVAERLVPRR